MQKKVSFIIATYNRADILKNALESFILYGSSSESYEIIVVDNNSKDHTKNIVEQCQRKLPLQYIQETRAGVSFARNTGVINAISPNVFFIDDDARILSNTIDTLEKVLGQKPDVFGGPIHPYYITQKPEWFKDEYEVRTHYSKTGWIPNTSSSLLSSSNMGFSKKYFEKLGGFNENLGPKADLFEFGEDSEIIQRAKQRDAMIYYDHQLIIEHLVPKYKMNLLYMLHRYWEHGKSKYQITKINDKHKINTYSHVEALYNMYGCLNNIHNAVNDGYASLKSEEVKNPENILAEKILEQFRPLGYFQEMYTDKIKNRSLLNRLLYLSPIDVIRLFKRK